MLLWEISQRQKTNFHKIGVPELKNVELSEIEEVPTSNRNAFLLNEKDRMRKRALPRGKLLSQKCSVKFYQK